MGATVGAGVMTGAPPQLVHPPPQLLIASQQAVSQPLSQPSPPNNFANRPPFLGEQLGASQQLVTSQPQAGSQLTAQGTSQPLSQHDFPPNNLSNKPFLGAPQVAISQPQAGSQTEPQGASKPQTGSQTGPQGASHPQAGSQTGPQGAAQGASSPQVGSQPTLQGATSQTTVSQQVLSHPLPLRPSIRSSKSKPKLWEQKLVPRTMTPTRIVRFMEPRLLRYQLGRLL